LDKKYIHKVFQNRFEMARKRNFDFVAQETPTENGVQLMSALQFPTEFSLNTVMVNKALLFFTCYCKSE
jgi:hypothetical protein